MDKNEQDCFGQGLRALHIDGGNFFDDLRIDISESHRRLDHLPRQAKTVPASRFRNLVRLYLTGAAMRLGIYEPLTVNGIRRRWLDDFRSYWSDVLNGRPFWNTIDFFMLLHDYRKRQQHTGQLEWGAPSLHLSNWQHPNQIYSTLHGVRMLATHPTIALDLWNRVPSGARVLEYGCSLAPYYAGYREFFSHLNCRWTLADIPNFPFHYARYLYRNDADLELVVIGEKDFTDPLGTRDELDVVILTNVLEHLDDPSFVSDYLLKRLKPGGLFVFDYIKSEGTGLDHPKAVEMRQDCIGRILAQAEPVSGKIGDATESLGRCIARKRQTSSL